MIRDGVVQDAVIDGGDPDGPNGFLPERNGASQGNGKPSLSVEVAARDYLTTETQSWNGRGVTDTAAVVAYGYRSSAPLSMPSDISGFSRFNTQQIAAAERALLSWSEVANISFVRNDDGTGYTNGATILFSNYAEGQEGAAAFAYYPGSRGASSLDGDVWISSAFGYNLAPRTGNYGQLVLVHELGHAIGMEHPGYYNAGSDGEVTYTDEALYYEDTRQYTIMSYFSERESGANFSGRYASGPMLDDIAAIQRLYGPNLTTRTGDTVYGFNATDDASAFAARAGAVPIYAVWDAGGQDTFDFSGFAEAQYIDLRPGAFSNIGGLTGSVAIAVGVWIEAGFGGGGNDVIFGNGVGNVLSGEAGFDVLYGQSGDDFIYGGDDDDAAGGQLGDDFIYGGNGHDSLFGNEGRDVIYGQDGDDLVYGGDDDDAVGGQAGIDYIYGGSGQDSLFGNEGDDFLFGELGADTISGGSGRDEILGAEGDDWLLGDDEGDLIFGQGGNDQVYGGEGSDAAGGQEGNDLISGDGGDDILFGNDDDDVLLGGEGGDILYGGQGFDVLYGGAGDDVLSGELGADRLNGGQGRDVFLFGSVVDSLRSSNPFDVIEDFERGVDSLNLTALRTASGLDRLVLGTAAEGLFVLVDVGGTGDYAFAVLLAGLSDVLPGDILF